MAKKGDLIYGVGINDADYVVQKFETLLPKENGKRVRKLTWICPFYYVWKSMIERCYSKKFVLKYPTYQGCQVIPEWHYFMTFKAWMEKQDWEGKELDKDLLIKGNKIYGPEACIFIERKINSFLTESTSSRGYYPIGVSFHKESGKYQASCRDVISGKQKYLGLHSCPQEAHQAWLTFKLEQAKILADMQEDPKVSFALIERYKHYRGVL